MAYAEYSNSGPKAKELRRKAGSYVRSLRVNAGMTQQELSKALGLDYYTFISQVETGMTRVPPEKFWEQGGYIYCSNIHNTVTVGSSLKVHLANLFFGPGGEVKRVPLVSSVEWSDKPLDTSKAVETASFAPTRKGVTS